VNEYEMKTYVRSLIKQEICTIMMASVTSNETDLRTSAQRFATDANLSNLRSISPFGFHSRATKGTPCVMTPINHDPTNIMITGHYDQNRPQIQDGETVLYGADGQLIHFKSGGTIHQGSKAAAAPVVLGDVLKTFLEKFLDDFINSNPLGYDAMGLPVFISPTIKADMTQQKTEYVETAATNILGQKNFVERGA